jgi:TPP-dependent pyruvate/acetoin dehydrogenase alpha subunit
MSYPRDAAEASAPTSSAAAPPLAAGPCRDLVRDHRLLLLHEMLRIRRFDDRCAERRRAGAIHGAVDARRGDEAIAVGVMQALGRDDTVIASCRAHAYALARGTPMDLLMAELYGRQEGCCMGLGGASRVFAPSTRFLGVDEASCLLPLAAGVALDERMRGRASVTACFFRIGTMASEDVHEVLAHASRWKLPLLFVAERSAEEANRAASQPDAAAHARTHLIDVVTVGGVDVLAVEAAAKTAARQVRSGGGPLFLDCRMDGRDPVAALTDALRDAGALPDPLQQALSLCVADEVDLAVRFAEAGTPAQP